MYLFYLFPKVTAIRHGRVISLPRPYQPLHQWRHRHEKHQIKVGGAVLAEVVMLALRFLLRHQQVKCRLVLLSVSNSRFFSLIW